MSTDKRIRRVFEAPALKSERAISIHPLKRVCGATVRGQWIERGARRRLGKTLGNCMSIRCLVCWVQRALPFVLCTRNAGYKEKWSENLRHLKHLKTFCEAASRSSSELGYRLSSGVTSRESRETESSRTCRSGWE